MQGPNITPGYWNLPEETAAALTGGFQWAFWVTGLTGLAAVPVTFLLIRRTELARAAAASRQREPSVAAAD